MKVDDLRFVAFAVEIHLETEWHLYSLEHDINKALVMKSTLANNDLVSIVRVVELFAVDR